MIELTKTEALQLLDEMDNAIIKQLEILEGMESSSPNTKAAISNYKSRRAALAYAVAAITGKDEETAPTAPSAEPDPFGSHVARRFLVTE